MKSVGEVMAIGRTFKEALGKAWRGLEKAGFDLGRDARRATPTSRSRRVARPAPSAGCSWSQAALAAGHSGRRGRRGHRRSTRGSSTRSREIVEERRRAARTSAVDAERRRAAGARSGSACPTRGSRAHRRSTEAAVRRHREALGVSPRVQDRRHVRRRVPCRARPTTTRPTRTRPRSRRPTRPRVVILGAGPNRIGQGIEFDYACVHAAFALRGRRASSR